MEFSKLWEYLVRVNVDGQDTVLNGVLQTRHLTAPQNGHHLLLRIFSCRPFPPGGALSQVSHVVSSEVAEGERGLRYLG